MIRKRKHMETFLFKKSNLICDVLYTDRENVSRGREWIGQGVNVLDLAQAVKQ